MKPKFINVILLCSTRSTGSANERYHTGGQLCRVLLNIKIKKCLLTRSWFLFQDKGFRFRYLKILSVC